MSVLLIWVGALAVVLASELRPIRVAFTAAAFAFLTSVFMLVVGDPARATLLALILALTLVGASAVKHHHSGMKLAIGDLALTFAGTVPFMLRQYRGTAIRTITGAVVLLLAAVAVLALAGSDPLPWRYRLGFVVATGALTILLYVARGGPAYFRPEVTKRDGFFSFVAASLIDVPSWWPTTGLRMLELDDTPLPLAPPRPARDALRPDVLFIQHESVFDPRLYGLPVNPAIAEFLSPSAGRSGRLHVEIYGGGSWQTEFSLLTGLSAAGFGPDSYFLFKKGVGRFAHSLPSELAALGYRTMLSTSCRRNFMGYDPFYAGLDVEERVFSDDFPPPFDLSAFEISNSDADYFAATSGALEASLARDPAPRFLMMLTNFNHGPHEERHVPKGAYETERAEALQALADPTYGEYYARLAETAASFAAFKARLAERFPGRPILIVRYGDHQPTMTRSIEHAHRIRSDDPRQFETFFAIEGLNFAPDFRFVPEQLDITELGTIGLAASGLPLDAVTATRLALIEELRAGDPKAVAVRRRRFHRTLVDAGLIRLQAAAPVVDVAVERS